MGNNVNKLDQLTIIREMIASLATLTPAGKLYMTGKIVALLKQHVEALGHLGSTRPAEPFRHILDHLAVERSPFGHDVQGFSEHAENLRGLLANLSAPLR